MKHTYGYNGLFRKMLMKHIMVGICTVISVIFIFTGCRSSMPVNVEPVVTLLDTIRVTISDGDGYVVFEPAASVVLPVSSGSVTDSLYLFPCNLEVSVIAQPQADMEFVSWGGELAGEDSLVNIVVNGFKTIIVSFSKKITDDPVFVGCWNVFGWQWNSSGGDRKYTDAGDSCYIDIRSNGTWEGWLIDGSTVVKSGGTWTADKWYIYFISETRGYEKIIWESKSETSLSLIQATEAGQIHEMCTR